MTVTLTWWVMPVLCTILFFAIAWAKAPHSKMGGQFDFFTPFAVIACYVAALIASLLAWLVYNAKQFEDLVLSTFNSYPNLNVYLNRSGLIPYEEMGRYQDEDGAKHLDHKIYYAMGDLGVKFDCLEAGVTGNEIRIMDLL